MKNIKKVLLTLALVTTFAPAFNTITTIETQAATQSKYVTIRKYYSYGASVPLSVPYYENGWYGNLHNTSNRYIGNNSSVQFGGWVYKN